MKKGISFSVIPMIALIGVLGLTVWAGYQLSVGSSRRGTSLGVSGEDESIQDLELVKNLLLEGLETSSAQAALDIADNGGTEGGTTYWYCNGLVRPTPDEVESSLSHLTLDYLNAYVDELDDPDGPLFEIESDVPEYQCVRVFEPNNGNPSNSNCNNINSGNCEEFATSSAAGSGALIEINEPIYVNDDAELEAYIRDMRFHWIYYRLYNELEIEEVAERIALLGPDCYCYVRDPEDNIVRKDLYIQQQQDRIDHCYNSTGSIIDPRPSGCSDITIAEVGFNIAYADGQPCTIGALPGTVRPKIQNEINELCNNCNDIFRDDPYVHCSCDITCFSELHLDCIQGECSMRSLPDICSEAPTIHLQAPTPSPIISYGSGPGSVKFRVTVEDSKFSIPSGDWGFKELVWNIYGAAQLEVYECPIIGEVVQAGSPGAPNP